MSKSFASRLRLATALIALPVLAAPALGQQANLGGGFIEFLVTGRAGGPTQQTPGYVQPQRATPAGLNTGSVGTLPDDPALQPVPGGGRRGPGQTLAPMPETRYDPRYERQSVSYPGPHRPGTIVVDTPNRFLYLVQTDGTALRYGIGVGRPGFEWAGAKTVTRKAEWPDWRPPSEMLKRRPDLPHFMAGGPDNPLGARALYLGSSLYRIHGTNEPSTIGQAVSSGCIRMRNEDVTDLYERIRVGQRVVVI